MINKTILQYECCKAIYIAYLLLIVYKNYLHWESNRLYKDIVRVQLPESYSMTLFLTVAMDDARNAYKGVTSLIRGTFYLKVVNKIKIIRSVYHLIENIIWANNNLRFLDIFLVKYKKCFLEKIKYDRVIFSLNVDAK